MFYGKYHVFFDDKSFNFHIKKEIASKERWQRINSA